jgi:hypothetical protein
MADGDDVGVDCMGGGRSASGSVYVGMAGRLEGEKGVMPSGVDWREPLKCDIVVEAGLPRELGMVIEAVILAKLGDGEGMRGRTV